MIALVAPVYVVLYSTLLWSASPTSGTIIWGCLVVAAAILCGITARSMCQSRPEHPPLSFLASMASYGVAWGSLSIFAMPDNGPFQALAAMVVFTAVAANSLFSAAVPKAFWAFHLSVVCTISVGYLSTASAVRYEVVLFYLYTIPFAAMISAISTRNDERSAYLSLVNSGIVRELSASNEQLALKANQDSLTGLSNRTDFTARLEVAMAQATAAGSNVGLLFLDIDHFKVVNDSLGHAAGDELLIEVAHRIQQHIRPSDLLARLGGDEFTVLVPMVHGITDVEGVAARVLTAFEEPFALEGRFHLTSASIGVACTGDVDLTAADLLRLADAALYQAKGSGRARASVFDHADRARLDRRLDDEAELRSGLANGELSGWFQPIVNLQTGAIEAGEGLVRWERPDGIVNAAEFIELASEAGLDMALSTAVLADLRVLAKGLRAMGNDIELGFNLPPVHLLELLELFDEQEDLSGLTIEITETGLITDLDRAARRLSDMRSRGASIWLDDFGQGQSSMSLLTQLPLDAVKIDRHFVAGVIDDRISRSIVSAIVDIGRNLGYRVIAEGVETAEQAAVLRAIGATHGQGYLFSPAVPPEAFLELGRTGFSYADVLDFDESKSAWFARMLHERRT